MGWIEELSPGPSSTTADTTTAMKSSPRAAAAHHREKKRTPETEERPADSSTAAAEHRFTGKKIASYVRPQLKTGFPHVATDSVMPLHRWNDHRYCLRLNAIDELLNASTRGWDGSLMMLGVLSSRMITSGLDKGITSSGSMP
nr:hypothetical protein Iba_chr03cCG6330 [Ipomoea batatas]